MAAHGNIGIDNIAVAGGTGHPYSSDSLQGGNSSSR
jgi:hypothetical protein